MNDVVRVLREVIKPEALGHVFRCALNLALWYKALPLEKHEGEPVTGQFQ